MTAAPVQAGERLAVWGGFECSVTRLGGVWRDQVRETGHHDRPADLDHAAALGLATLRYPFIWERVAQDTGGQDTGGQDTGGQDTGGQDTGGQDTGGQHTGARHGLAWHDGRMARLRALGLGVVAGLLHHGSGPDGTSLLDPALPESLARHAGRIAERYPDIMCWTPVNEPLTTARFSCLYGTWYPHARDPGAFLRATAIQCRAVLLSMRAIRRHVPKAQLLQTEDIAHVLATPPLAAQARYENERRWLSLDLLCGMVDRAHPWRGPLEAAGVGAAELDELASGEAAPDLIGVNYYVTSERFLDHRTALYPAALCGGNGRQSYADTEAVRVRRPGGEIGWLPRLREVWQRYRRPLVISEAHLGGADPFEQARWFMEAWQAAHNLRRAGGDVRAVTAWALAGAVDWDSLMQQRRGHAEWGAWDLSEDPPRPRLLAALLQGLARDGRFEHEALDAAGWWRREDRFDAYPRRA